LALLGEPGIGKTYAMQSEQQDINAKVKEKGEKILWRDLRAYGSEDRLIHDLFESAIFVSWVGGNDRLHIFLDSLDECLLRIDNLAALLVEELKKYPIERLNLRIACRTFDWPNSLEACLIKLWGHDAVKVYELAPLRRKDVIEAAKANGLDYEAFLREIDRMEAVPLAIKPVTLRFLINTYSHSGHFPTTQAQLYLEGCRILCEESSESRRDTRRTGDFTAEQRMAVAARIAAITVFAKRYTIWTGADQGDVSDEDVTLPKLCGGNEYVNDDQFYVQETAVRETLDTGLFSSRGVNRMGWAHQTYAEFLAARYLVQHEMTLTQTMSLLCHPDDPEKKLVPQLHETAAWLAGMQPDIFREIMKLDPEVLLRSDVATADVKDRAALLSNLLKLYDEEKLFDRDPDMRRLYRKVNHPKLAEQLRPYICDSTKGIIVRRVAIDIAEACKQNMLQGDLIDIVFDQQQPSHIREEAAHAVFSIGDIGTKAKMKPLIKGECGEDPDDQLKGYALQALWPDRMTANELFSVLTVPKRDNFFGAYQRFISHDLPQHIGPTDLPMALEWVAEQGARHQLVYSFRELIDKIMLKAWAHLESPGVLQAFAKAAIARMKQHDEIIEVRDNSEFRNDLMSEDGKRRLIINAAIPLLTGPEQDAIFRMTHNRTSIVLSKDLPWMIELLLTSKSDETKRALAQLIWFLFDIRDRSHVDAILNAIKVNSMLAKRFEGLIKPVKLNSPEAKRMKKNYLKIHEWEQNEKQPLLEPPPAERIALLLDECENGDVIAWWRLNREMTLEPNSKYYGSYIESDLTVLPGWKSASDVTKSRIIRTAEKYLLEKDPAPDQWLGKNVFYHPAAAGYRALRLLYQEAPDVFSSLSGHVWKKWAPIILAYPSSNGSEEETIHNIFVKIAYQHAPDEIIETLIALIDQENREHDYIHITHDVEKCWDDRLANALLIKLKDKELKPGSMSCLLRELLEHKVDEARAFAETLVPVPLPSGADERVRVIAAACELLAYADDAAWSAVWSAIQQDEEFGLQVIEKAAQADRHASIGQRLAEDQLEELYVWLVYHYPYDKDPKHEGDRRVGARENAADFRDSILRYLQNRGTYEACESIRRIADTFPELDWLKWTLFEAQAIARRRTWIPPNVDDILRLANDSRNRLIQNGDQLLDVLIESLKRLEAKLQGETPASPFIWDKTRPKDENQFSDFVKIHLDDDLRQRGIIVNREVRIHRGERTDIHVDAVVQDQQEGLFDPIVAIIEVKGCWNSELDNAMETQLVNQYLKNNRCQHGLYLVGWFNCEKWDSKDYRKKQAPKLDIDVAQKRFDAQAAKLSQHGTCIKAFVINAALS